MDTIQRGDQGAAVRYLQKRLIATGYTLPRYGADSDFGGETEQAVQAFQRAHGLAPCGIADTQTWTLLLAEPGAHLAPTDPALLAAAHKHLDGYTYKLFAPDLAKRETNCCIAAEQIMMERFHRGRGVRWTPWSAPASAAWSRIRCPAATT